MQLQDAVELGVFIKEAMLSAGKPFAQLSTGEISVALRRYEILRSDRVAHIIDKSRNLGLLFWATGFLVSYGYRAGFRHILTLVCASLQNRKCRWPLLVLSNVTEKASQNIERLSKHT